MCRPYPSILIINKFDQNLWGLSEQLVFYYIIIHIIRNDRLFIDLAGHWTGKPKLHSDWIWWIDDQLNYLDADSFDGQQEGIEWMKAGDLHELLFLLVWYARLDSLQQGMGLEGRETHTFKAMGKATGERAEISVIHR